MNYKLFIKSLEALLPDQEKLKELNYSDSEISEIKQTYLLKFNNVDANLYPELGEFGELISRYNLENLHVGMISFYVKPIKRNNNSYIIGEVEVDHLIYTNTPSKFYVYDGKTILWECANKPDDFLDALIVMIEYFSKVIVDESIYENFDLLEKYAKRASSCAGGDIFISFYRMLLGI